MSVAACDAKLAQLERKLQKVEASRQRLREGLEKAKQSAEDTSELLRQHIALQETAAQAATEVDALRRSEAEAKQRAARAQAQREQAVAETSREHEHVRGQLTALQAQLERAQRAAGDARSESAKALSAVQKYEAELASARKQAHALRDRVRDLEHQQKASAEHNALAAAREQQARLSGQVHALEQRLQALESLPHIASAATIADLDAVRSQLAAVSERLCRAERDAAGVVGVRDKERAALDVLRQQVAANGAEQRRLATSIARLNGVVSAFARAVAEPAVELAQDSSLLPAAPAPGRQRREALGLWSGVACAPPAPATSTSGSLGDAAPAAQRDVAGGPPPAALPHRGSGLNTRQALAGKGAPGVAASPANLRLPGKVQTSARYLEGGPTRKRPRMGSGPSLGAEGSNLVASPPLQAPAACLATASELERAGCSGASAAAPLPAAEVTAAEIVEGWLAGLTRGTGLITAAQVTRAAAGLQAAMESGQCPLPCVKAGFETAFLECAAAGDQGLETGSEVVRAGVAAGVSASDPGRAWCSEDARSRGVFVWLLRVAADLDVRLRGNRRGAGLLEPLRAHMHVRTVTAAVRPHSFDTEACALCAAAAALCRLLGAVQAMRALVYELLRAHAGHPAALLPRLLAALLAWPEALPPAASADLVGSMVHAAVLDITRDVLRAPPCPADDTATVLGLVATSTAEAACGADVAAVALQLWEMGRQRWGWSAQQGDTGQAAEPGSAAQWRTLQGALQRMLDSHDAAPEAALSVGVLRALDLALGCMASSTSSLPGYPTVCTMVERSTLAYLDGSTQKSAEVEALLMSLVPAIMRYQGEAVPEDAGLATAHKQLLQLCDVHTAPCKV